MFLLFVIGIGCIVLHFSASYLAIKLKKKYNVNYLKELRNYDLAKSEKSFLKQIKLYRLFGVLLMILDIVLFFLI